MELTLVHRTETQINVICEGHLSHSFDLRTLVLKNKRGLVQPPDDPVGYGKTVYFALFPPGTLAQQTLGNAPERLLLVATDSDLDAVSWEYACDSEGFLVLKYHFVRGLPVDQRVLPPVLDSSMYIVAVPSDPLSTEVRSLNIDGEWIRLKEVIQEVPMAIILERTHPPTLEQLRRLVANQQNRIVHFMGHGGQGETGTVLFFEQGDGDLDAVTAEHFIRYVRGTVFLITLNACVSATPGSTAFGNLGMALVQQKTPYALGMRFSIEDEDARTFSRVFYSELARGTSIEEAVFQVRLTLAKSSQYKTIGVPVLYTSLKTPATGFPSIKGIPNIKEHRSRIEVSALPRAEGTFQGRINQLKQLGKQLTGDKRPRLLTIHGDGGQGKTVLAREAVERFAYAWPGGIWAITLENLPSRAVFVNDLARFLGIATQEVTDPSELERRVAMRLVRSRMLIVLDNAETLTEAVAANNKAAVHLAQFIREQIPWPPVSILATSRSYLGWDNEVGIELVGLLPHEGARLFQQNVSQWVDDAYPQLAYRLSQKVEGHPLSLRLLGSAFNASNLALAGFVEEYEAQLLKTENKYKSESHRQRTLYASIEASVGYLDSELRSLLSGLWVFHAPFLPETAVAIFDPENDDTEHQRSLIYDRLHALWQHSLITRETAMLQDRNVLLYHLLPTMRPYVEQYMEQTYEHEALLMRFGAAYTELVTQITEALDHSASVIYVAHQAREDLERGVEYVADREQVYYRLELSRILHRLGYTQSALQASEQALEFAQSENLRIETRALNGTAVMYQAIGQYQSALELYSQVLREEEDREDWAGKAATLNNIASVYLHTGQPQRTLEMVQSALSLLQETENKALEAALLNSMAAAYQTTGQLVHARELYEQALSISRKVGNRVQEANELANLATVHQSLGHLQQALELFKQALSIQRELEDRTREATTLSNVATLYNEIGQPQRALEFYQQALLSRREIKDQRGEAATLSHMGNVYQAIGQPQHALELYTQALPIIREVEDRDEEALTLNNMAYAHQVVGELQLALDLHEQALSILLNVGNRADEAATRSRMADIYRVMKQPQQALELCKQALSIQREVKMRREEGVTLNNLGLVYQSMNQQQEALEVLEQALSIRREVNDRDGEATTLSNIGVSYQTIGQPQKALEVLEQALQIMREVENRAREATILSNIAAILHKRLKRIPEAILRMEQAIAVLIDVGLSHHAGGQSIDFLYQYLAIMKADEVTLRSQEILQAVQDFVDAEGWDDMRHIMETKQAQLFLPEAEVFFEENIAQARMDGDEDKIHILEQYLAILHLCKANGIAATFEKFTPIQQENVPFPNELISRSIKAALGDPQEKLAHAQYLTTLAAQTTNEGLQAFIKDIQLVLFNADYLQLGQNLQGVYQQAWEAIVFGIETKGTNPGVFEFVIRNTLAVLGRERDKRLEWRDLLIDMKGEAMTNGAYKLVTLFDAIINLLDADGNPAGLGKDLKGVYAKAWQLIVEQLS